ncbi:ABC transporter substrate-binding protein [Nonomuraea antimicrobica]|uniref:ABC transporter substrate-binding protein n=1 Tax=Nonomuraea antimicrobica TaxID=561173 RepID=A0ABP7ELS1_9ACTN
MTPARALKHLITTTAAATILLISTGCASSDGGDAVTTAGAASTADAAGSGSSGSDLSDVTLSVAIGSTSNAFLKTAGLFDTPYEIEPIEAAGGKDIAAAVVSGRADLLLLGDVVTASLLGQDIPLNIVYAQQRAKDFCGILVPKTSPITSIEQLKGKTIGNGVSTAGEVIAIRAFQQAGLDYLKDVERVDLATTPELQAAFVSGQVDALAACTPPAGALVTEGQARWLVTGENGLWNAQNYWVLTDQTLRDPKKVAAALDYLNRFRQSLAYTNEHHDELIATLSKETQVPAEQLRASFAGDITPVAVDASVVTGLQNTYDALGTAGRVPAGKKLDDFFDDQYTAQING